MMRTIAFLLLAAAVPIASLMWAVPPDRTDSGLAVRPFGWPSLVVVHVVSALPFAWIVAGWIARRATASAAWSIASTLVGLLLAGVAADGGTAWCGDVLDVGEAGFAVRGFVRSVMAFTLIMPWVIAARPRLPAQAGWLGLIAAIAAIVLPAIGAAKLAREQTAAAQDELSARRLAAAMPLILGLGDLDPERTIVEMEGTLTIPAARRRLTDEIAQLTRELAARDTAALPPKDALSHANGLIAIGRAAEAVPILRELARTLPPARLPLARAWAALGRWDESDREVRTLLAAGLGDAATNPRARKACVDGYDLLVESATKRRSNADREAVLRDGLSAIPLEEAYFRFQLGRHYRLTGRPWLAIDELSAAASLDDRYRTAAERIIRELRESTPACLIGRSR